MDDTQRALALYGTVQPVAVALQLRAGPWACELREGQLRNLRWQGVEVVRGISYLLRDRNWGTVPATMSAPVLTTSEQSFDLRFQLHMTTDDGQLACDAHLHGHADGQLVFEVHARASAMLWTNRCGFVVLHPASVAGQPLEVQHTGGSCTLTAFPLEISPSQPVFDIRALRHRPVPGLDVAVTLEAELPGDPAGKFEMEDQRNWSDASFKTYVASLLDPWPYALPAGRSLMQRVTVRASGGDTAAAVASSAAGVGLGQPAAARMPLIGVGIPTGLGHASPHEREALRALPAHWWIAEIDLRDRDAANDVQALVAARSGLPVHIQLDVIAPDTMPPAQAAEQTATWCRESGLVADAVRLLPAALLNSFQPSDRWPDVPPLEDYAAALRTAFPQAQVGGGMYTSFTELNRKRPRAEGLDFIGHLTCPIVHAPDDASVMQTMEALPHIVRSVKQLWPGLAYRLGPSTLAPRRNPYGATTAENPNSERVALANRDPRHAAAFGAAWVVAYAAAVAFEGLDALALLESHGPSGPLGSASALSVSGHPVPAWQALEALARAGGSRLVPLVGLPPELCGMAWLHEGDAVQALVANVSDRELAYSWHPSVCIDGQGPQLLAPYGVTTKTLRLPAR